MISKKCMTRECSICHDMIDGFAPQAHSESLRYYQRKSTDNRIEKIVATDTIDIIFNELKKQLNTFLLHTFVKIEQAAAFNSLKSSSDGISIVLQVDFLKMQRLLHRKKCNLLTGTILKQLSSLLMPGLTMIIISVWS